MERLRILCVDDDAAALQSLQNVLNFNGFAVEGVSTVADALNLVGSHSFDVLLADLNIGEPGDGFTVVSAMRRVQPQASTFILTGYPDFETALKAIRNQVDDYFPKPLRVEDLLSRIATARNDKRNISRVRTLVRMSEFIRRDKDRILERWLEQVLQDTDLSSLPLNREERIDSLPALLDQVAYQLERRTNELSETPLTPAAVEDARHHGRLRYEQGFTIPQIVCEMRILQQVLSNAIQEHLLSLDLSSIVPDITLMGECVQASLEISIRAYQSQSPKSLQSSLASLYRSPDLGVVIADEKRILDANETFLRLIQHTREQLLAGQIDWRALTPEEFRPLDQNGFEQLREYGTCVPFEKEFLLRDGTRMPFLIGAVRLSTEPMQWCAFIVDLTKQRKLQAAERKVRDWEAKYGMINRLAHEINNPLAALTFTLHLLNTDAGLSGDACELVKKATEMLDRTAAVVKQVLEESRGSPA